METLGTGLLILRCPLSSLHQQDKAVEVDFDFGSGREMDGKRWVLMLVAALRVAFGSTDWASHAPTTSFCREARLFPRCVAIGAHEVVAGEKQDGRLVIRRVVFVVLWGSSCLAEGLGAAAHACANFHGVVADHTNNRAGKA